jgi:hypothetical protein
MSLDAMGALGQIYGQFHVNIVEGRSHGCAK